MEQLVGIKVECTVCRKTKAPRGRSVPQLTVGFFCDSDCSGYDLEPLPGDLWPGENSKDFGYMVSRNATAVDTRCGYHADGERCNDPQATKHSFVGDYYCRTHEAIINERISRD